MNQQCICDYSSEECSEEKREEDTTAATIANKIFLNFTREYRHPAKDRYNQEKVRELFKYLRERPDIQEMKVSGWPDDRDEDSQGGNGGGGDDDGDDGCDKEDVYDEDEEEYRYGVDSYSDDESCRRGEGQRFAMSRDFWYRKLNTLKARKLDEAALEAEDLPPDERSKPPKCIKFIRNNKVFADEVPETKDDIIDEMNKFDEAVAKPVESVLKSKFVNVYDNRNYFQQEDN